VADGGGAGEFREDVRLKNFIDLAHGLVRIEIDAVGRDDAGGFLAAMLEGVETEISELGGFGVGEDADDAALVVEMVVAKMIVINHARVSCL
jgi:hypothetical protein